MAPNSWLLFFCSATLQLSASSAPDLLGAQPQPLRACKSRRLRLLLLVSSAPDHFPHRMAIRMTWGRYARDVAFSFVLGRSHDRNLQTLVTLEQRVWGDMIIANFTDTYRNLTLKTLAMLQWVQQNCPLAKRLVKSDDDVFFHMPRLLDFVWRDRRMSRAMWGSVRRGKVPGRRQVSSKYYVSREQYPPQFYPPYAAGPTYMISSDVVPALARLAGRSTLIPVEDAFFTGVLRQRLGVRVLHEPRLAARSQQDGWISLHRVTPSKQFYWWNQTFYRV